MPPPIISFVLRPRPVGLPDRSNWNLNEEPVGEPKDGEVLVKVLYISLDPAMRGWMNEGRSYIAGVEIGAIMMSLARGREGRVASKFLDFADRRLRQRSVWRARVRCCAG